MKLRLQLKMVDPDIISYYENACNRAYVITELDSGFDVVVPEEVNLRPFELKLVDLQIAGCPIEDGVGYYIYLRSSACKKGLVHPNGAGIIDWGYRGNLKLPLRYIPFDINNKDTLIIEKGERLAQICAPDLKPINIMLTLDELPQSRRGSGGFGSTGTGI